MAPRVLVIGGVASGVGKTSITLGLLEALRRRGVVVQAFKVGPDFIDPGFHALVTGRPSANLDGWMCGRERVLETVARYAWGADLLVVEGAMGCFDGLDGTSEDGSTAQIAKWLGAPLVLVADVSAQSRTIAAVVLGIERFDPALRVSAVIANRVGGDVHARWVADAIRGCCEAEPLGAIRWTDDLRLPERHLGLVTAAEGPLTFERLRRLGDAVAEGVDLDRLLDLAAPLSVTIAPPKPRPEPIAVIGVARDAAFQFYYDENLARLEDAGARLVFWSPLADRDVPDADAFYFGGGYPELHARELSENQPVHHSIRAAVDAGLPIYAECGGLMYLAESLEDPDGARHRMVGILPGAVRMTPPRMTLAYAEIALTADAPLGGAGTTARGHSFHVSTLDPVPETVRRAYRVRSGDSVTHEGYLVGSALMSYVHVHFASNPDLAGAFVRAAAGARRSRHGDCV